MLVKSKIYNCKLFASSWELIPFIISPLIKKNIDMTSSHTKNYVPL